MTAAIGRLASVLFNSYCRILEVYYGVLEQFSGFIAKNDQS